MSRDGNEKGAFASRWSRLKQEARAAGGEAPGAAPAATPAPAGEAAEPAPPSLDDLPDEEVLRRLGLPDPDTLKRGDDFAAFMVSGVPLRIRNRALRRLWLSDPVLANLDGLIDYAEDYSDAAKAVPGVRTAYQVGKGYLDLVAGSGEDDAGRTPAALPGDRPAVSPEARPDPATGTQSEAAEPGAPASRGDPAPPAGAGAAGPAPEAGCLPAAGATETAAPRPRTRRPARMVFRTSED